MRRDPWEHRRRTRIDWLRLASCAVIFGLSGLAVVIIGGMALGLFLVIFG